MLINTLVFAKAWYVYYGFAFSIYLFGAIKGGGKILYAMICEKFNRIKKDQSTNTKLQEPDHTAS